VVIGEGAQIDCFPNFGVWIVDVLWDGAWIDCFPNCGGLDLGYCGAIRVFATRTYSRIKE